MIASRSQSIFAMLCFGALAWLLLSGCGAAGTPTAADRSNSGHRIDSAAMSHSIERCLLAGGARTAFSQKDLTFLMTAEENEEVSRSGLAYDRAAQFIVRMWSSPSFEKHPPRWTVWFGQSPNSDYSPLEILEKVVPDAYVLYVRRPSREVRTATARCIDFETGQRATLHAVRGAG